ncbi:sugar phosphate isomerase/epimerase [Nitrososphaera sp.]|uniref:sugar phosphate isomerase/epimerase family protein n=1 Tax=Nitrososphaera sp. TaxID=1971748 RepID=UPI00307E50DE
MKYSITLASFRKIEPVEETIARLAPQGFDAVEMYGEPDEADIKGLKDALSTTGLKVCGVTGMWGRASRQGRMRKLLSADQSRVSAAEKYVEGCVRMCSELGGSVMNVCLFADDDCDDSGGSGGGGGGGNSVRDLFERTHGTIAAEEKRRVAWRALPVLSRLCSYAADNGVTLALEPLNRYSTPYCATAADALAVADRVEKLGILLDTFHMNIEEDSFEGAIAACRGRLVHTHFADNNRKMPGFAHIDFKAIVSGLQGIGYGGYVSFEPNIADKNYEHATKRGLELVKNIEKEKGRSSP